MDIKKTYYGWWIVASGFFIALYTAGVINFGFTAVFEPIVDEFGWSYTQVSLATSLRGLETGLLAPVIGYLVDKWGPRRLLFLGVTILGLGCLLLSVIRSLPMFYFAYILIAIGLSACGGTLFNAAVVIWFRERFTLASGILSSGVAVGGIMVPIVTVAVDNLGWRTAMVFLGLGMWIICLPLAFIVKNRPKKTNFPSRHDQEANQPEMLPTQALKSRAFWHITVALTIQGMVLSAVLTHVMPYLSTLEYSRITSSFVASAIPIFSILGRLGFGWLGEKYNKLRFTALGYGFTCLGLFFFGFLAETGVWSIVPFLLGIGLGWGTHPMRVSLIKEYFGRSRFGTIHGFVNGITLLGNIVGPPLAGLVFDTTGSYQNIWYIFAGISFLSIIIVLATPPPSMVEESHV